MRDRRSNGREERRRGIAAVVMVVLLLVVNLVVVSILAGGGRDHDLSVRRLETVRAFYAAEGGMNMAIREIINDDDEDGDGTVGSISDDGNDANNPDLGAATVWVEADDSGGSTILTSAGRSGEGRRDIEVEVE